ncbi:MAG: hypothetical protein R3F62_24680 [Planctomycetota bacterium]
MERCSERSRATPKSVIREAPVGLGQDHVGRLEVPVQDALAVGEPCGPRELRHQLHRLPQLGVRVAAQPGAQGLSAAILQDEVGQALVHADVQDPHDPGVPQLARHSRLELEARQRRRVWGLQQDLERDGARVALALGEEHRAHGAAAQLPQEPIRSDPSARLHAVSLPRADATLRTSWVKADYYRARSACHVA